MTKAPGFWLEDWGEPLGNWKVHKGDFGEGGTQKSDPSGLWTLGLNTELCRHGSDPDQLARDFGNSNNGNNASQSVVAHGRTEPLQMSWSQPQPGDSWSGFAACTWPGQCLPKQKYQHSAWDLNKTQDLITHFFKSPVYNSKLPSMCRTRKMPQEKSQTKTETLQVLKLPDEVLE